MLRKLLIFSSTLFLFACNNSSSSGSAELTPEVNAPATINYSVVNVFPHDTTSYTEGFLVHDGQLYESTGYSPEDAPSSKSLFGIVDLKTGKIQPKVEIDKKKYFGEGITYLDGKWYQLTYTTKVGFIYDGKTFKKIGEFTFPSEQGWGLTTDGTHLVMSDGTSNINFIDPTTFRVAKILGVTDNNGPVSNINDLEIINGYIYANQWQTNYILKIDTASGKVVGRLDLSTLATEAQNKYPQSNTLNGIAFDPATNRIFVTGKLWPNIYEIKFNF
ncbi:MAG: glutamine cyclotransferase [Bacteroidetes bacterium]|nr:MAG: glutamine cyclotransferase [Bacteroidota bacterium]